MSWLTGIILIKSLNKFTNLFVLEKSIGWFLIEHVFEEYELTAGKFFIVNDDFRTLIQNFIAILRNILFLAQAFTPLEFFTINFLLIFILIFYKNKSLKIIVRTGIMISYFMLFQSFLFLNIFLMNTFLVVGFIMLVTNFYIYFLYVFITSIKNKKKDLIKFYFFKFFIFIIMFLINALGVFNHITFIMGNDQNPILIISIIFLIPYTYIYYIYLKNN